MLKTTIFDYNSIINSMHTMNLLEVPSNLDIINVIYYTVSIGLVGSTIIFMSGKKLGGKILDIGSKLGSTVSGVAGGKFIYDGYKNDKNSESSNNNTEKDKKSNKTGESSKKSSSSKSK